MELCDGNGPPTDFMDCYIEPHFTTNEKTPSEDWGDDLQCFTRDLLSK